MTGVREQTDETLEDHAFIFELPHALHKKLPAMMVSKFVRNLKSCLEQQTVGGRIQAGCGCTGTGAWVKFMESNTRCWEERYGITAVPIDHALGAENVVPKQDFICKHCGIDVLLGDIKQFENARVSDVRTPEATRSLPSCTVFGAGYSCLDKSKQNSKRKNTSTQAVRNKRGSTGNTFAHAAAYIVKVRPKVSYLECVTEVENKDFFDEETGDWESDSDFIKETFERHHFTVICCVLSARERGSAKNRVRWWASIFDMPLPIAQELGLEATFHELLASLKLDPYPIDRFFLAEDVLATLTSSLPYRLDQPPPKKIRDELGWKLIHEMICLDKNLEWPRNLLFREEDPSTAAYSQFRIREGEVISIAIELFPLKPCLWHYFDANHTAERSFKLDKHGNPINADGSMRNPWQIVCPTLTSCTIIVCRKVEEDGTASMRRLHCLEALRLAGWDLCHFHEDGPFFQENQDTDLLTSFAGNMWTAFHFLPLHIASSGCVDWNRAIPLVDAWKQEQRKKKEEEARATKAEESSSEIESYSCDDSD